MLKKLKKYVENPKFLPEIVEKTSKACKSMCLWVRALDLYAKVYRTVEPKRERLNISYHQLSGWNKAILFRLKTAQTELDKVMAQLNEKQEKLSAIESKVHMAL